ncbi:MBL fold metallo-hydrolase [Bradyrhizobium sp. 174]|uniref:MBL fold metallo-hydrolase n=1 Tax=Bradyrhizobium sp. 174 TaxID=2782645 RepID=UPI001FF98181|nr:MBL fold metallo-hydrolase [Bradyrhizobium sp. 174]MCK1576984.1 MBL fold metallo-hydrolase [Bradyrhizobium sp. 174]
MRLLNRLTFVLPFLFAVVSSAALAQDMKVTLLGTGSPPPVMNRFGPSILVEAGDRKFLFDVGRGAMQRLAQTKTKWQDVDGVFFTHLHSDHVVGFPDVWLTGWLVGPGRNRPLEVWGPPGTEKMLAHLVQAFEFDIKYRISDDKARPEGVVVNAHDINPGVSYEQNGVKITAIKVDHAPVEPAYGYRIDFNGRSVVLSGDTRTSENLIRAAEGVDLLVHEVVSPETFIRAGVNAERTNSVVAHHVTPEQAGEVFARTKPRLAVYSHLVQPTATNDDLIPGTRKTYDGALEVGEDLMVIEVGKDVVVRRPSPPKQ